MSIGGRDEKRNIYKLWALKFPSYGHRKQLGTAYTLPLSSYANCSTTKLSLNVATTELTIYRNYPRVSKSRF
jgi:hypothetical protein